MNSKSRDRVDHAKRNTGASTEGCMVDRGHRRTRLFTPNTVLLGFLGALVLCSTIQTQIRAARASGPGNTITIDVDPTLGPASEPVVDMTKWGAEGYMLQDDGNGNRTLGLRIFQRLPDGMADPGHHEIRKTVNLTLGQDMSIDDLATIPIVPGSLQLPQYWDNLAFGSGRMSFQPDLPHTFYFDTSVGNLGGNKELFQEIIENWNRTVPGYEGVMTDRITENADFVGSGQWDNPAYPSGFEMNNFRNSVVIFDGSFPAPGAYDPVTKVLVIGNYTNQTAKQEVGQAIFGRPGTILSQNTPDTAIDDRDIIAARVAFNSDVQGSSGETRRIELTELYAPNADDGSGIWPGSIPEELGVGYSPSDANGTIVYELPEPTVGTERTSFGRVKSGY